MAVTAFNEEAKRELTEYLERKAGQIAAKTVEEQRAAMQESARLAFRSEASGKAASLGVALGHAMPQGRLGKQGRQDFLIMFLRPCLHRSRLRDWSIS
ncbi:MAG: hypothetical protein NTX45_21600 [Proteobacteria bacterium]|nr:hypothetical protein [Pseudomonadota bacterium]